MSGELEVRSFRAVFALERRIYRIDTLRLNPGGVPLRGIAYAAALVALSLVAGVVPPTEWLDPVLPWYARDLVLPIALAIVLAAMRIDGRAFHTAAAAVAGLALRRRRLYSLARVPPRRSWYPPDVVLVPDGSDARFRSLRYVGPGAVHVRRGHVCAARRRLGGADVTLQPAAAGTGDGAVVDLRPGAVLEVRAG